MSHKVRKDLVSADFFVVPTVSLKVLCVPKTPNCPTSGELRGVRPASADSFVVAPRWANLLPS